MNTSVGSTHRSSSVGPGGVPLIRPPVSYVPSGSYRSPAGNASPLAYTAAADCPPIVPGSRTLTPDPARDVYAATFPNTSVASSTVVTVTDDPLGTPGHPITVWVIVCPVFQVAAIKSRFWLILAVPPLLFTLTAVSLLATRPPPVGA